MLRKRAWAIGYRVLRNRQSEQEDFSHDAATKVLMSLDRFEATAKFSTWATSVMTNMALETLRRGGRAKREAEMIYLDAPLEEGQAFVQLEDPASSAEVLMIAEEQVTLLMGGLGERDRTLLWQFGGLGYTTPELSEMHGMSIPATKSALHNARRRGRAIMEAIATNGTAGEAQISIKPGRVCKCGCGTSIGKRGWPYTRGHSPERELPAAIAKPVVRAASKPTIEAVEESVEVTIRLTESQLDGFWKRMPLQQRAELMVRGFGVEPTA